MRYYLLIEHVDGHFRVLDDHPDELRKYEPREGETVTLLRRAW